MPVEDILCYSVDNVRAQVKDVPSELGFHTLRFYAVGGRPSREKSETVETFYYYPSGGTIRDRDLNIVFYEPKLDTYHTSTRGE